MSVREEINQYEQQINTFLNLIKTDFKKLNDNVLPSEINIAQIRNISARINDYCTDIIAYQDKINSLKRKIS